MNPSAIIQAALERPMPAAQLIMIESPQCMFVTAVPGRLEDIAYATLSGLPMSQYTLSLN